MKKPSQALCAMFFAIAVATPAAAAVTYCKTGTDGDPTRNDDASATIYDVTLGGITATDCAALFEGNHSDTVINSITAWQSTKSWELAAKADIGSDPDVSNLVDGIRWSVASSEGKDGTWLLSGVDENGSLPNNLDKPFDFIVAVKGGPSFAAYLFDDFVFGGLAGGTWQISFLNPGGNFPDLSNLSVYVRDGNVQAIPEPSTYALMGAGLLAIDLVRRRRAQSVRA